VACFVFSGYFPWGDSSEMWVTCGGWSGISVGGLAGCLRRMRRFSVPGTLPSIMMYDPLTGP
jgi:hypothetical protein